MNGLPNIYKNDYKSDKGVALLAVFVVMIIGLILAALCFYLISRGNQTYQASKNYAKAINTAQGGAEEAVMFIEKNSFDSIEYQLGTEKTATSGAKYLIWRVFWNNLSGFGGAPVFPPVSGSYSGVAGTGVYYLVHSQATVQGSQADLYVMYVKGY